MLPPSAGAYAGPHVPRSLTASAGGGRPPGERAWEEGEDEGTGLWVISVLGGDVAAAWCGLCGGRGLNCDSCTDA